MHRIDAMEQHHITLIAKAHNGTISIQTEIPVSDDTDTYVVTIGVKPQSAPEAAAQREALDGLYGVLADAPLPEITEDEDRAPEERDVL
jgi:hypothetical protein